MKKGKNRKILEQIRDKVFEIVENEKFDFNSENNATICDINGHTCLITNGFILYNIEPVDNISPVSVKYEHKTTDNIAKEFEFTPKTIINETIENQENNLMNKFKEIFEKGLE